MLCSCALMQWHPAPASCSKVWQDRGKEAARTAQEESEDAQVALAALEAAIASLQILGAPDMPQQARRPAGPAVLAAEG